MPTSKTARSTVATAVVVVLAAFSAVACTPKPVAVPAPVPAPSTPPITAPTSTVSPGAPSVPAPVPTTPTTAAPRPAPTTTTSTTTTMPVLADPVPGFARLSLAPMAEYSVNYEGLPGDVDAAVTESITQASELSGIALTRSRGTSNGPSPQLGEIRIRMGNLCGVDIEAGCAIVYGTATHIVAADVSISEQMAGHPLLLQVVLHELGHALGLLHVDATGFAPQIMGNRGELLPTYQGGDRAGLAALGAAARTPAGAAALEEVTATVSERADAGVLAPVADEVAVIVEQHELTFDELTNRSH